jgi:DNA repair exonuclease SbcCD ATPase subunit
VKSRWQYDLLIEASRGNTTPEVEMLITRVEIANFLSIGSADITFPEHGLILVSGWNESLQRANGAGKSSIFQAICWCLYDEFPRDIKVDELVKRGESSCTVTVHAQIEGCTYKIVRKRPASFELWINNTKEKGNPKFLTALLHNAIGFTYDQFLVTSYFPQKGDSSRFLKQKDSIAKEFLSTVLNFSKAESAYKRLHNEQRDVEQKVNTLSSKVNTLKWSLEKLSALIASQLPSPPDKAGVLSVKRQLELIDLKTQQAPNTEIHDSDIKRLQTKMDAFIKLSSELDRVQYQIRQLNESLLKVDTSSRKALSCPACSESLILLNDGLHVHDDESATQQKEQQKIALQQQIETLSEKEAKYKEIYNRESGLRNALDTAIANKALFLQDYKNAQSTAVLLRNQLSSFKKEFEAYKQAVESRKAIEQQVDTTKHELDETSLLLAEVEREYIELLTAKQILSPTGAIAYSLDSIINDVNEAVRSYLDIFSHGTMAYQMRSGEDKLKITHSVTYDESIVSIGSLSGGEERGLILSVDFGLSDVLAKRCGKPLPSIVMLDECFEGLDYVGKEKVLDSLREIAQHRCIIVIDHSTEFSALFDARINVVKKHNTSVITYE